MNRGTLCRCNDPLPAEHRRKPKPGGVNYGSPITCRCGWQGFSHVRTKAANYKVVDCPDCGTVVQPLTAEQAAVVERASGRSVAEHVGLVRAVIRKRYRSLSPEERDELYEVGVEALMKAAIRYVPNSGVRFGTYATTCISGTLSNHRRNRGQDAGRWIVYATLLHTHRPERVVRAGRSARTTHLAD